MKKLGVYCAILMLIPGAVPGSAAELAFPGQADLSVLVQRSGAAAENLRLGELALENNDDYAAAEFLSSALQGRLDDPSAQLRAANYLHRSYLRTNQKALADELLEQLRTQKEFANEKQLLLLMQIRTEAFAGNHSKVIELCRQAEIADQTGNQASCELLELQGRAFQCLGDCKAARQSFERLLKLAGKDDCARLVALDGIVLNSLGLKDTNQARKALDTLKKTVPEELQKKFAARLQQLEWLTDASAGNTAAMETPFRFLAEKSEPPNVLLSRIALVLGDNYSSKKEFAVAGKYYAIAFKLAEIDFKQTALGAMLKNDLTAGDLKSALEHTRLYRKLYPAADDAHTMALLEAHLHNHLKDGKSAESTYLMLQKDDRVPQDIRYASALELIKIYQKSNRSGDAEKLFRFAINIAPDLKQKNMLRQLLGEYFYQLG
ncbi:MAG: hypothetical protein J6Q81_00630, partial [Lentisphaeria bacterium]|nr:hypothetical protein [Lentisphaeria bacterium]